MNGFQSVWYEQVRADHSVLLLLRKAGAAPCHQLHYLQMVTEKLGKAYLWRTGQSPPKIHAAFVRFLKALDSRSSADVSRIAALLGFSRTGDFENWIRMIAPLAYDLERLAPALAGDNGPNPEYPWPRLAPVYAPSAHEFDVWTRLTDTGSGRQLLNIIDKAIVTFPQYA